MMLGLLLPVAVLVAAAILVPRGLERMVPETLGGLVLNGAVSALVLILLSAGYFFLAYLWRSTALLDLIGIAPGQTLGHFLRLGFGAGLIWAPVVVLAVSTAPKRWREAEW